MFKYICIYNIVHIFEYMRENMCNRICRYTYDCIIYNKICIRIDTYSYTYIYIYIYIYITFVNVILFIIMSVYQF